MRERSTLRQLTTTLLMMALTAPLSTPVAADPPPWAPAHGYRDKHKHKFHDDDDRYMERYPTTGYVDNG